MRPPGKVLIPGRDIQKRVRQLAGEIKDHYQDKPLTVVALMNGSVFFLVDLLKQLPASTHIECWRVSSYKDRRSSGTLAGLENVHGDYSGRHVLVVDDILDTGLTMHEVMRKLRAMKARSVRSCVLLQKDVRRARRVCAHWHGFEIGDEYVFGYGLDLDHAWRALRDIRVM